MDVYALLKELGFGDYETKAYVTLLETGQSNGYEVAKVAGMPRANVYAVLERLVERGAVQRYQTAHQVRYSATAPKELLNRLDKKHQATVAAAGKALAALAKPSTLTPAFNLHGVEELLARAHVNIDAAVETLLVAIQPSEAAQLAKPLKQARDRGVNITTLCLEACERECGGCQGQIHRFQLSLEGGARRLVLVADQQQVLLGQFAGSDAEGLLTAQPLVIELASTYIRQSLVLALLGDELGERFGDLLSTHAQQSLDSLYPGGDFLAHFKSLGDTALS